MKCLKKDLHHLSFKQELSVANYVKEMSLHNSFVERFKAVLNPQRDCFYKCGGRQTESLNIMNEPVLFALHLLWPQFID